jgi:hypothetical protein
MVRTENEADCRSIACFAREAAAMGMFVGAT